jgi:antitoxin component HigA of HigAB toxin-antitoxin module
MATEIHSAATSPADGPYFDLVRAFPLRPIRSAEEHDRAIATVDALSDRRPELRPEEYDYLIVLALLIERYEDDLYPTTPEVGDPATGQTP